VIARVKGNHGGLRVRAITCDRGVSRVLTGRHLVCK